MREHSGRGVRDQRPRLVVAGDALGDPFEARERIVAAGAQQTGDGDGGVARDGGLAKHLGERRLALDRVERGELAIAGVHRLHDLRSPREITDLERAARGQREIELGGAGERAQALQLLLRAVAITDRGACVVTREAGAVGRRRDVAVERDVLAAGALERVALDPAHDGGAAQRALRALVGGARAVVEALAPGGRRVVGVEQPGD